MDSTGKSQIGSFATCARSVPPELFYLPNVESSFLPFVFAIASNASQFVHETLESEQTLTAGPEISVRV